MSTLLIERGPPQQERDHDEPAANPEDASKQATGKADTRETEPGWLRLLGGLAH